MTHGDLKDVLRRIALPAHLRCRVYLKEPWPEGARAVFDSGDDFVRGMQEAERQGANWFEIGKIFGFKEF